MNRVMAAVLGAAVLSLSVAADGQTPRGSATSPPPKAPAAPPVASSPRHRPAPKLTPAHATSVPAAESQTALVKQYCATCHSDKMKSGGLTLASFDMARAEENAPVAEKMIRKLRAGMMPPPGAKRPDEEPLRGLAVSLEARIDQAAAANPNPGRRPFQRLNRAEYALAVRDLLSLVVDVSAFLPPDTISHGFDNVADVQTFSPTLMEGYLRAASRISRMAVGDRNATASSATYKIPRTANQMRHIEGAPIGTRGGISVVHTFVADGEYVFKLLLHGGPTGELFGGPYKGEHVDVSIDGERVGLLDIDPKMRESDPNGLNLQTTPIYIKAGPHRVSAAFIERFMGPVDDLMMPIEHTLADSNIGEEFGITALPHLRDFTISGPVTVTGVSDTPSRRKIFTCRPATAGEEAACAADIIRRLARQAYRGSMGDGDYQDLTNLYEQARKRGDFEDGIRMAIQGILASPRFLFRLEQAPPLMRAGDTYRIADRDLASRLSFFLWGTVPDAELTKVANQGLLRNPEVFDKQVRRMLADARSEALSTRFAAQWLRLQDVDQIRPDHVFYPQYDYSLGQAYKRETELFFDSIIREDRSVLDLLTADYSFVNERIAKQYGLPNVTGDGFRRVQLPEYRRGLLGQGSILMLTSVADRTSPVLRGKWIMEVLLGSPPPPPPPNVPDLEETKAVKGARVLSVRERMEEHRKSPACNSCHRVMDPLGLALDNFDVTGAWRIKDNGVPIDASGDLYDGSKIDGPAGLRQALLKHSDSFLLSFTESLMTYALGRRVEYYDMPAIRAIVREAAKNNNRISWFLLGVIKSGAFQMSKVDNTLTTEASAGAAERRHK